MNEMKNIEVVGCSIENGDVAEIGIRYKGSPSFSLYSSSSKTIQEYKDQLTQKDKQIELLLECVKYVKASHRCICGNDKQIPCSRCETDKAIEKYKEMTR